MKPRRESRETILIGMSCSLSFGSADEPAAQVLRSFEILKLADLLRPLDRIVPDVEQALMVEDGLFDGDEPNFDGDEALPVGLWDPDDGQVAGGQNHADEREETV